VLQRYKHNKSIGQVNLTNILKKVWYAVIYFLLFVTCAYVAAGSITYTLYTYFCVCASVCCCINFVIRVDHVKQFLQVK
jgi:hypothetical protein